MTLARMGTADKVNSKVILHFTLSGYSLINKKHSDITFIEFNLKKKKPLNTAHNP